MQANVGHDESCLCMPCRIVHLRHYEFFKLWELWDLFKESLPRATSNALDKAYLATMKCVVVSISSFIINSYYTIIKYKIVVKKDK